MYYGTKKNKELGRKENRWERDQNNQEKDRNKGRGGERFDQEKEKISTPSQAKPRPDGQRTVPILQTVSATAASVPKVCTQNKRLGGKPGKQELATLKPGTRSLAPPAGRMGVPRLSPGSLDLDANISISQRRKLKLQERW